MTKAYVAYNRRSGIPWATGLDEDQVYDYAGDNDLAVMEVTYLSREIFSDN